MAHSNDKDSMKPGASAGDSHAPEAIGERGRGRDASKPSDIPKKGWLDVAKRTFQQLGEDNLSIVAAGMAFYAFTATVPALAAMISTYALVADPGTVTRHVESFGLMLPEQTRPLLQDQLTRLASNDQAAGWGALIGIGIALFGAMKAMTALMTGLNIAYDEDERRGFFKQYLTAFLLTLGGIVGALIVVGLLAVAPALLSVFGTGETAKTIFDILRWPLLAGLFVFALSVVYRYAPCRDEPRWRWVTWGAGLATVLWLAGSGLFAWYASSFGDYEGTYGSLGAVVVFLTWLYLTSYVVLLGAEFDAEMERQTARDTTKGEERPMGSRGAHSADTLGPAQEKPRKAA